ncbi:MAG: hypothetical protein IIA50_00190 [Bacteroidetes bacterium]|nr:hypothetical protein [Bacteroidota bacterium]
MEHYTRFADLFSYPKTDYCEKVEGVQSYLDEHYPRAGALLEDFTAAISGTPLFELEELYIRSFDVQAITTLDIGYILFGDDYKRGAMLVNMNREHKQVGNPCYNELADHLPNVLRLLPLLEDDAFRTELVDRLLAPALQKIIGEFDPGKIEQKQKVYRKHHRTLIESPAGSRTIYRLPLMALYSVIQEDFHLREEIEPQQSSDFLKGIATEIKLESFDAT